MVKRVGCRKGSKAQVVIEEFGAVIDNVFVYCNPKDANDHVNKFIKNNFGSRKRFNEEHGETDKGDIYHFETKVE